MAEYDDGAYYEVQLNNKQLVFFFMATLAIAVVVFLCGVMVGRGVRDATLAAAQNDIAAGLRDAPVAETAGQAMKVAADKPKLDYPERLESDEVENTLKSDNPETAVKQKKSKPQTPPPSKPQARRRPTTLGGSEGAFTIQVVALKTEDAAQSLLSKLKSKNYRAYLEDGGEAGLHRVRVGRFPTRAEAEKVAQKLRVEERFKPYITQ